MEISCNVMRVYLWLAIALSLSACSSSEVVLKIQDHGDLLYVEFINQSSHGVVLVGGGELGIPPSFESIQWHVSSNGKILEQCAFVDSAANPISIKPGEEHRSSLKKSVLERVFCVPKGDYAVRVSYIDGGQSIYSNEINLKKLHQGASE